MGRRRGPDARDNIIRSGIDLIRRNGFVATSVDDVCAHAGITKGAFFHYFDTKEALAEACLRQWDAQLQTMVQTAPFQSETDPVKKLLGCMDFLIGSFGNPRQLKSCLAGTTVQEVFETHPNLRKAANACFVTGERLFKSLLDDACKATQKKLDTASLAKLWLATMQGSFILCKASRDGSLLASNLKHVKQYIEMSLSDGSI